jgi:hypothetical protein
VAYARLPESVHTLYAELLDQLRSADAEFGISGSGSFVTKKLRGRTYWYLQKSEGATKRQIYLGPESPDLLERIDKAGEKAAAAVADDKHRRDLVSMLAAGGMVRESAAVGTVLRILAEAGLFRAGGVLIGTHTFRCLANLLGVSFPKESLRTADIDIAHDGRLAVALPETTETDLLRLLRTADPAFFAVPSLDVRHRSTSFSVRGRDLRVDFLTPDRSRDGTSKPRSLPHFGGIAAHPLKGLDYLIDDVIDAAVLAGGGIHVNVPQPARFAFHKLWVAVQRPASETAKARKDTRQAEQLLEVLIDDRPDDVTAAYIVLRKRPSMLRAVERQMRRLEPAIAERLEPLVRFT